MPQANNKQDLKVFAIEGYTALLDTITQASISALETNFIPKENSKCCTFEQGENLRDLLVHIYEWQMLQIAFVNNIRQGCPKDFIPEPYRKNYKEMDQANWEKHRSTSLQQAMELLQQSHNEVIALIDTFSEDELFGKKVFKVTYTTTMAAYFSSVTITPYAQSLKRLKTHLRSLKKM